MKRTTPARSWLAHEEIQTSLMDCGPAALKSVLQGFGIPVNYELLRERCQTDIDGTSMDALAALGNELGLESTQLLTPRDGFLLPEADCLPAIVVTRASGGQLHFIVVWGTLGPFVQIMDPAGGRRWVRKDEFVATMPDVPIPISVERWRRWASSENARAPLAARMRALGVSRRAVDALLAEAESDPGWRAHGALDAAVRMVATLVQSGAMPKGRAAERLIGDMLARAQDADVEGGVIPKGFWWASTGRAPGKLVVRGAVVVHFARRGDAGAPHAGLARARDPLEIDVDVDVVSYRDSAHADGPPPTSGVVLPPGLQEALLAPNVSPVSLLWQMVRFDAPRTLATAIAAVVVAALVATVDTVVLRDLFDAGRNLTLAYQRAAGIASLVVFVTGALLLDSFVTGALQRVGRGLEMRFRVGLLEKLPKLEDRYLRTRPTSDMASRGHAMHALREAPAIGGRIVRAACALTATIAGIAWLHPAGVGLSIAAAAVALLVPYALRKPLAESTMRLRTHAGTLDRFYLDALLGAVPIQVHGAARSVRREHEAMLVEWTRTAREVHEQNTLVQALQSLASTAIAAGLVVHYLASGGRVNGLLLLVFWALRLPSIGQELVGALLGWRNVRNVAIRLFAPLGASEVPEAAGHTRVAAGAGGVHIELRNVSVKATGHTLLRDVSLEIVAGEHVAIVGASGAGKSSLVSLLLGWLQPASGELLVDGALLDDARLAQLREETAWVDPAVFLFNRSLLGNVVFGDADGALDRLPDAVAGADLAELLEGLPHGLQSSLGEGGGRVSGGQGQRVRLARALMRKDARLVILDEPFRGLERERRRELLRRARAHWKHATILFVSHDVGDTAGFDRALVVEHGAVVEQGSPGELARDAGSRYHALDRADRALREDLWSRSLWRRLRMDRGTIEERAEAAGGAP